MLIRPHFGKKNVFFLLTRRIIADVKGAASVTTCLNSGF